MHRVDPELYDLPATGAAFPGRDIPVIAIDMPVMYEDEGQEEIGESIPHTTSIDILHFGLKIHFVSQPDWTVLSNLNVYYHLIDRWAYVSPDVMLVRPFQPLSKRLRSYRIGTHGPAPHTTIEVLSQRSFQQQDLHNKPIIYSQIGVAEYIMVDTTGEFLEQKLLLKRLQDDGTWRDEQDRDGGVTSKLGFRLIIEPDEELRILNASNSERYFRPEEADAASRAADVARRAAEAASRAADAGRIAAEERVRALEEELARLRKQQDGNA
jgi:Uma2 family endonuclease